MSHLQALRLKSLKIKPRKPWPPLSSLYPHVPFRPAAPRTVPLRLPFPRQPCQSQHLDLAHGHCQDLQNVKSRAFWSHPAAIWGTRWLSNYTEPSLGSFNDPSIIHYWSPHFATRKACLSLPNLQCPPSSRQPPSASQTEVAPLRIPRALCLPRAWDTDHRLPLYFSPSATLSPDCKLPDGQWPSMANGRWPMAEASGFCEGCPGSPLPSPMTHRTLLGSLSSLPHLSHLRICLGSLLDAQGQGPGLTQPHSPHHLAKSLAQRSPLNICSITHLCALPPPQEPRI